MAFTLVRNGLGIVIFSMLALADPLVARAQAGQLSGIVTDQGTGRPVAAVQVLRPGLDRGTLSQPDGTFTITNVPAGSYVVVAQRIGFAETSHQVTVAAGSTTVLEISIAPPVLGLQPIAARGYPAAVGRVTGTVYDLETGGPLQGAWVTLQGFPVGSLSDTDGRFSLTNVPAGIHTLVAQRIGFQEARHIEISVLSGANTTLDVVMNPAVAAASVTPGIGGVIAALHEQFTLR
jgi:hypothetical protein